MAANYVLLAKNVVGAAGASSVTFSNIPQTGYTDLVIKGSVRTDVGTAYGVIYCQFNSAAYANQTYRRIYGDGSSAGADNATSIVLALVSGNGATANTFGTFDVVIPNYTSSNYKSLSSDSAGETNATTIYSQLMAGLWSDTAPITSITLVASYMQYSTFYLYGVAKSGTTPVIGAYATGGDVVTTDGTYWYHTFNSSGTFTPRKALTPALLVVGGGGRGGVAYAGGGGGGGGVNYQSSVNAAASTSYTITVGAAGSASSAVIGSTYTGSAGSQGTDGSGGQPGGSSGAPQSYSGGTGTGDNNRAGGGGGGAAGVGANGTVSGVDGSGGRGGNGYTSFDGLHYGAGGGGTGLWSGRGQAGNLSAGGGTTGNSPYDAVANSGCGGGGASAGGSAGAGGSGIVIIKYAV